MHKKNVQSIITMYVTFLYCRGEALTLTFFFGEEGGGGVDVVIVMVMG